MRFEFQPTIIKTDVLLRDFVCLIEVYQQFSENFCRHLQDRTKIKYSPRNFDSKLSQPRRHRYKFVAPWGSLKFIQKCNVLKFRVTQIPLPIILHLNQYTYDITDETRYYIIRIFINNVPIV